MTAKVKFASKDIIAVTDHKVNKNDEVSFRMRIKSTTSKGKLTWVKTSELLSTRSDVLTQYYSDTYGVTKHSEFVSHAINKSGRQKKKESALVPKSRQSKRKEKNVPHTVNVYNTQIITNTNNSVAVVTKESARTTKPQRQTKKSSGCKYEVDERVKIEYKDKWYDGRIIEIKKDKKTSFKVTVKYETGNWPLKDWEKLGHSSPRIRKMRTSGNKRKTYQGKESVKSNRKEKRLRTK
eukprot:203971_1